MKKLIAIICCALMLTALAFYVQPPVTMPTPQIMVSGAAGQIGQITTVTLHANAPVRVVVQLDGLMFTGSGDTLGAGATVEYDAGGRLIINYTAPANVYLTCYVTAYTGGATATPVFEIDGAEWQGAPVGWTYDVTPEPEIIYVEVPVVIEQPVVDEGTAAQEIPLDIVEDEIEFAQTGYTAWAVICFAAAVVFAAVYFIIVKKRR